MTLFCRRFGAVLLSCAFAAALLAQPASRPAAAQDAAPAAAAASQPLELHIRKRIETKAGSGLFHAITEPVEWDPAKTAIMVCDMWDNHWCHGAARRVGHMAPRMNEVLEAARHRGVFIIHCPSDTMDFYKDTPQRKLAQAAPAAEAKVPLQRWCRLDRDREGALPIDDTNGGCDCTPYCKNYKAWSRQISTLTVKEGDAVTDSAEAYNLLQQRGIDNVIVMGVHTNMCVLGRPFSIRQMVYQGKNVVLMRDLTDTMYDPRKAPFVNHFTGTDLVVEHIEKHWCPTITSADFLGGKEYRFPEDKRLHLAIVIAEDEYQTHKTLPEFAAKHLGQDFRVSFVFEKDDDHFNLPGIEVLNEADVALFSIRRRVLPTAQLDVIRQYLADGKPLVGIRTTSHAFSLRDKPVPEGLAAWPTFDKDVLGCNYTGHYGSGNAVGDKNFVWIVPDAAAHPIMTGVPAGEFPVRSWLYKSLPLNDRTTVLMLGRFEDQKPHEPVAWTHVRPDGGRVFYTSLGHPDDFGIPAFTRLLQNGIYFAANLPVPPAEAAAAK